MYYSFIIIHQKNLYVKEKLVGTTDSEQVGTTDSEQAGTTDGEKVGIIDRNTSGSFIFSAKHCIHILILPRCTDDLQASDPLYPSICGLFLVYTSVRDQY